MVAGLRSRARIFQTPAMRRIVTEEFWPGAGTDSDEDCSNTSRTGSTTFHQTGTCMMGPTDVGRRQRVAGARHGGPARDRRLGDADGGFRQHQRPAIMIAEKASDLIRAGSRATARAA